MFSESRKKCRELNQPMRREDLYGTHLALFVREAHGGLVLLRIHSMFSESRKNYRCSGKICGKMHGTPFGLICEGSTWRFGFITYPYMFSESRKQWEQALGRSAGRSMDALDSPDLALFMREVRGDLVLFVRVGEGGAQDKNG